MDFIEKAKIRLENWIKHNDHHEEEYKMFADQLETAGKKESSEHVREMMVFLAESNECLIRALQGLDLK
jgi:hypothetical protein